MKPANLQEEKIQSATARKEFILTSKIFFHNHLGAEAAMAGRGPLTQLCEELTCSVCLEYFKDPLTIPECGHNFCRGCLTQCWGESEASSCPQCRKAAQPRNLLPNWQLANVVAIAKELSGEKEKERDTKRLEGEGRLCKKHEEPLKLFCQQDQTLICLVCHTSKVHRSHEVVPLEEASQEYKDKFQASLKIVREERAKLLAHKESIMKESQDLVEDAKSETQRTVAEFRKLREFLEEQENLLLGEMALLEKEIARERDERLARLSSDLSCLETLIRDMEEKQQQPAVELLQDVRSTLKRYEEKQKFGDLVAFTPELKEKFCSIYGINVLLQTRMKQFKGSLLCELHVQTGSPLSGLQVQKVNATLDPDTANPRLVLSENRKSVRWQFTFKSQELPDNPERFDIMTCVMGCEEFTAGRHAWEVILESRDGWNVGVARKSVRRKGQFPFDNNNGIWSVSRGATGYLAYEPHDYFFLYPDKDPKRILVSLNYEKGRVTFLDPDRGTVLCEFSGASFSGETLQPFFHLFGSKARLRLSP